MQLPLHEFTDGENTIKNLKLKRKSNNLTFFFLRTCDINIFINSTNNNKS